MTERQELILKIIIEEYIKDAQPIGSGALYDGFDFGIGPAMIRQEMAALEKEGYLAQPHTSAGRLPTDKAYRFYISRELNQGSTPLTNREEEKIRKTLLRSLGRYSYITKEVSRLAAEISKELSIAGQIGHETLYTYGLSQLFDEPEMQDHSHINHLVRFMDSLDLHFEKLLSQEAERDIHVFIGKENPVREIRDFSLITGYYPMPQGEQGFVSIIGPRRMDYSKNMALVNYITAVVNDMLD